MKGYKFYLEFDSRTLKNNTTRKNLVNHSGNCLAVVNDSKRYDGRNGLLFDAFGAVQDIPNNNCCFTSVSTGYLHEKCKRISEKQARKIHPKLFERIED